MAEINEIPESEETSAEPQQEQPVGGEETQISKDARLWGMLCHLAGLAGFSFLFGNVILPLIFWQMKKDEFPFVDDHGKEAVNFQISITLYVLACIPLTFICVGILLLPVVVIFAVVMVIIAAIKANGGQTYRYPLCIRLIK